MIWEIILLLFCVGCIMVSAVDLFFFLYHRYCQFHIGRWKYSDWEKAIEKTTRRWLKHTPVVKITDNSRYILLDFARGKYRSKTIQSWQKAALILGLLESKNPASQLLAQKAALDLINTKGEWKSLPEAVDCGMLSYAILRAVNNPQTIRPAMEYSKNLIQNSINEEGMVSYTGGRHNTEMYVDTLGLTCAFLALYAKTYGDFLCEQIAFHQLQMYHTHGLMEDTFLPNHAFDIKTKLPLGVYGWGRGTAWYVIGLVDTYHELKTEEYREKVLGWILEAAQSYFSFQREDGGFGAILQRMKTYDSSATAVLAWFYEQCFLLFEDKKYREVSSACLTKLLNRTRITGAIDDCQGDTKGIGVFAQTYDVMPFAQGMALRAINLNKNRD